MHIGLVIYGSLDLNSGGFLYDRLVVQALEAMGDQVSVIELPWRSYRQSLRDNLDEALAFKLASADWEVLVEDELAHPSLVRTNRRVHQLSRRRFPIISLVHLLRSSQSWEDWRGWLYRQVERRYLRGVDGCIYVSRHTRQASETLAGVSPPSVIAYPAGDHLDPGLPPAEQQARADPDGPLQIIFLGSVVPRKALHTLLEALQQLPEIDWRLWVAGSLEEDPQYARRMQAQAAAPPLHGRVVFLGELPAAEVSQQLAASQVLALPSEAEGFPIACLEAMAHALPVITSAASGAPELVREGTTVTCCSRATPPAWPRTCAGWQTTRPCAGGWAPRPGRASRTIPPGRTPPLWSAASWPSRSRPSRLPPARKGIYSLNSDDFLTCVL